MSQRTKLTATAECQSLKVYGSELIDMWNCTEDDFVKEILSLEAAPIVRDGITYFESEEEVDEPPMYVPMKQ